MNRCRTVLLSQLRPVQIRLAWAKTKIEEGRVRLLAAERAGDSAAAWREWVIVECLTDARAEMQRVLRSQQAARRHLRAPAASDRQTVCST